MTADVFVGYTITGILIIAAALLVVCGVVAFCIGVTDWVRNRKERR